MSIPRPEGEDRDHKVHPCIRITIRSRSGGKRAAGPSRFARRSASETSRELPAHGIEEAAY